MKKIKSLSQAPSNIQKAVLIQQFFINEFCFGKASLENIKKLSESLGKEINSFKDTEDYNFNLVSNLIDKTTKIWTESGAGNFSPGDNMRLKNKLAQELGVADLSSDFENAKKAGDYESYIFSEDLSSELRQYFFLKTSKDDKYKTLLSDMNYLMTQFMDIKEWEILKTSMKNAEKRIYKNKLKFPNPIKGFEESSANNISEDDSLTYNMESKVLVDDRLDNHDLLAMKELVLLLKGNVAHPLTIGPSFFSKYLPELKQIDATSGKVIDAPNDDSDVFSGVVFHFHKNILKKIKLTKLENENYYYYSPVKASAHLYFSELTVPDRNSFKAKMGNFSEEDRFFVLVDGCVAVPQMTLPYQNEFPAVNDLRIPAAETFIFEKDEAGDILNTRLCLVPYDYSKLHLMHQHGSVIFGTNEQSFHSCSKSTDEFGVVMVDYLKEWWMEDSSRWWDTAVTAARYKDKELFTMGESDPMNILRPQYEDLLKDALYSISEISEFTMYYNFVRLSMLNFAYNEPAHRENMEKLVKHYAPLSRRWLLKSYLENESGITKDRQPTIFRKLSNDLMWAKINSFTQETSWIKQAEEIVKKEGIPFPDAYRRAKKGK